VLAKAKSVAEELKAKRKKSTKRKKATKIARRT
jgi:hypothetical protein